MDSKLTENEILFCELYVNGSAPYAGNAAKCYSEVFKCDSKHTKHLAKQLLMREDIQAFLKELDEMTYEEAKFMKKFLTENLIHIIEETSVAEYRDRRGTKLSPAPLRSVAVSATKALMEMYPVKEAQVNKLNIEGAGEGGITFNVIVPEQPKSDPNS
ncbi:MAG: hypothetical protein IKT30_02285 [Bacteroidaceae bacterium]|nr:hypothetical protein [Bacteroidaceae bacterium]